MPKFKIDPAPSFPETVSFRLPGGKVENIRVTFKYMDAEAYQAHFAGLRGRPDAEVAATLMTDWDADEPANEEGLGRLFKAYPTAATAFFSTFRSAIFGVPEKN